MSQENMEIARGAWDAWLRGDFEDLFGLYAPEVVWDFAHFRDWPETEYRGTDGVRRFLDEWLEVWDDYEVRLDAILEAPDGRAVCLAWQRGRGRKSGLAVDMKWAQIISVLDGKIIRTENFDDRSQALEAAGLSD